jgi:spore coat protein U-like protein
MRANGAALAIACLILPLAASGAIVCRGGGASMSLGAYVGDSASPLDSVGSFRLQCSRDGGAAALSMTMGIGPSASSGSISQRQMQQSGGTDMLSYNLYRDATRLSVWGQTAGVDTMTITQNLPNKATTTVTFTLYGRINALQNVAAGSYGDTLTVTIDY